MPLAADQQPSHSSYSPKKSSSSAWRLAHPRAVWTHFLLIDSWKRCRRRSFQVNPWRIKHESAFRINCAENDSVAMSSLLPTVCLGRS